MNEKLSSLYSEKVQSKTRQIKRFLFFLKQQNKGYCLHTRTAYETKGRSREKLSGKLRNLFFPISDQKRHTKQYIKNTTELVFCKILDRYQKTDEFQVSLTQLNYLPRVICSTETWLSPKQISIFKKLGSINLSMKILVSVGEVAYAYYI